MDLSTRLACGNLLSHPIKCFDMFCPSVQPKIKGGEYDCGICSNYFVTKSALNFHKKIHKGIDPVYHEDEEEEENAFNDLDIDSSDVNDQIQIVDDLGKWYLPLFIEEQ